MNRRTAAVCLARGATALLGLTLLAPGAAGAETTYRIRSIARLGDLAGEVRIKDPGDFEIGTLNDNGQLAFVTENAAGGETLIQYSDGKLTPIVAAGKDAPGGKWGKPALGIYAIVSMNESGNVVFAAAVTGGGKTAYGTYLWDPKAQQVTPVALTGMPAVNNLTFETGGGFAPAINNRNEVALVAEVKNAAGKAQQGIFFLGSDGKLLPVALPDEALPGGGQVASAWLPSISDAGVIAFVALPQGQGGGKPAEGKGHFNAYLWEPGTLTPVAVVGMDAPGGGKITDVLRALVNNKNRNVLVEARVGNGAPALYLSAERKLTPVAVPGQEMPGGGKLKAVLSTGNPFGVSVANEAGQHAFLATLEDGTTAAYRVDMDGQLSLILKSGTTTDLGQITKVGRGIGDSIGVGINTTGQVALTVQIAGVKQDTLVLLTPDTP
jgi:hypothetical protein